MAVTKASGTPATAVAAAAASLLSRSARPSPTLAMLSVAESPWAVANVSAESNRWIAIVSSCCRVNGGHT